MADVNPEFRRRSVPEVARPYVSLRGVFVLILAVLIAMWLRQNTGPTPAPTMRVVPVEEARAVDLPSDYVLPVEVPEAPPQIPADLPEAERQRRLEEVLRQPEIAVPVPPEDPLPE